MKVVTPIQRNGFWVLYRVPKRYAGFDNRKIVRISTRIRVADDPKGIRAAPIAAQLNRDLEAEWIARANGEKPHARRRYDDAVLDAKGLGFTYLPTAELLTRPLEEILPRIEKLIARRGATALRVTDRSVPIALRVTGTTEILMGPDSTPKSAMNTTS